MTKLFGSVSLTQASCSFIFCLIDPRDETIFYVGQTSTGPREPEKYVRRGYGGTKRNVCRYTRRLEKLGLQASWEILEEVSIEMLDDAERFWISNFRAAGVALTNIADGGAGNRGFRHTPEAKEKISTALVGRPISDETHRRLSAGQVGNQKAKGLKRTPETLEKMRLAMLGKNVGKKHTPEAIEKIRAASIENGKRPEVKKKLSAAANRRWSRTRLGKSSTPE